MYFELSSGIKRIKRFKTHISVRKFTSSFYKTSEGSPLFYRFLNATRALRYGLSFFLRTYEPTFGLFNITSLLAREPIARQYLRQLNELN